MFTHPNLIKLAEVFLPAPTHGICYGFVGAWVNALFKNDIDAFNRRLNTLAEHIAQPQNLKVTIDSLREKVKKGEHLTQDDREILDIEAFFQTAVSLTQAHPEGEGSLSYAQTIPQAEIATKLRILSDHTETQVLDRRTHIWDIESLKKYLTSIQPHIANAQKFTAQVYPILINNFEHMLGISYNADTERWSLCDANILSERNKNAQLENLRTDEVAEQIMAWLEISRKVSFAEATVTIISPIENHALASTLNQVELTHLEPYHYVLKAIHTKKPYRSEVELEEIIDQDPILQRLRSAISSSDKQQFDVLFKEYNKGPTTQLNVIAFLIKHRQFTWLKEVLNAIDVKNLLNQNSYLWALMLQNDDLECAECFSHYLDEEEKQEKFNKAILYDAAKVMEALLEKSPIKGEEREYYQYHQAVEKALWSQSSNVLPLIINHYSSTWRLAPRAKWYLGEAFFSQRLEDLNIVYEQLKKELGQEILLKDRAGMDTLQSVIRLGTPAMINWLLEKYRERFTQEEIISLVDNRNCYGLNAKDYLSFYHPELLSSIIPHTEVPQSTASTPVTPSCNTPHTAINIGFFNQSAQQKNTFNSKQLASIGLILAGMSLLVIGLLHLNPILIGFSVASTGLGLAALGITSSKTPVLETTLLDYASARQEI